jgi:hypothetical protein
MTGPLTLAADPIAPMHAATKNYVDVNFLNLAGGIMAGPITLAADPVANFQPATKNYVDTRYLPLTGGVLVGALTLAADPAGPLQPTPRQYTDAHYLAFTGGTLTGPLTLVGDPGAPMQPATKNYVDVGFLPIFGGVLTGNLILVGNPTAPMHPATKDYVDTKPPLGGPYLALAGGAMQGGLTLVGDPIGDRQAATKQYVDNAVLNVVVPPTPPVETGDFLPLSGGELSGPLTVTHDVAFTPAVGGSIGLQVNCSVSGTMGAVGGVAPFEILVPNNSLDSTGNPGSSFFAQTIQHNFGGTRGNHGCLNMIMQQTSNVLDAGTSVFINPLFSQLYCNHSGGGSGSAISSAAMTIVGGTGWGLVEGSELGVTINSSGVASAFVETYIWSGTNRATNFDAMQAYAVVPGSGTAPRAIWQLGRDGDAWPVDANGWLLTTVQQINNNPGMARRMPQACAGGLDFSKINFATAAFRSPGVSIEGTLLRIGPGFIGEDSNGLVINATGAVGSISAIAAGGGGYQVNDQLYDGIGGIALVTGVNATTGAVTAANYIAGKAPHFFGPGAPDLVATTGGSGTGADCVLHMLWTPRGVLSIQQAGGLTAYGGPVNTAQGIGVFGVGAPGARPTVNGSRGGNAALASLLTALASYGFLNDGSVA